MLKRFAIILTVTFVVLFTTNFVKANELEKNDTVITTGAVASIPAGSYILDESSVWYFRGGSNYMGKIADKLPVIWIKLADNHYVPNSTLIWSVDSIADYPYNLKANGIKDWANSDVRKFLNTTFYTHFSESMKNEIIQTDIPYRNLNGELKVSKDNVFLLSPTELNLTDKKGEYIADAFVEGKPISYFDIPGAIYAKNRKHSNSAFIPSRTINPKEIVNKALFGYNKNSNTLAQALISMTFVDLRPAMNIKSSTIVQGPYEMKLLYPTRVIEYYKILH